MSDKMTTSEPTTGEIVRALRFCTGEDSICGTACPAYLSEAGCRTTIMKNAADRLESQERELSGITGELEQYKKWHDESIATATNNIVELEHRVAALTARAEQAEARERAIIESLRDRCDFCIGYELEESDDPCSTCYNARTFEPDDIPRTKNWTLRGLPQEGEKE